MAENKYNNGKIYKIVDNGYNMCYYGSTVNKLSQRMAQHRATYARYLHDLGNFITSYKLFIEYGVENCKIELVEMFPCNSKAELEAREGYYIKNNSCVNKVVAGRTDVEYRTATKQQKREKDIEYRKQNKERITSRKKAYYEQAKAKLKEPIQCECGMTITRAQRKRHLKTGKHHRLIAQAKDGTVQLIVCECGATLTKGCSSKHLHSAKHKLAMASRTKAIEI